ncbi:MAG: EAL domain-containing protein [Halanaerobiales bacterium]
MFNFLRKSIKTKIMLLILFVSVFITVLLISLSAYLSNTYLTNVLNTEGSKRVNGYAYAASKWFSERKINMEMYAANPLIKDLDWAEIDDYLKDEQRNYSDIYNLFFVADRDGNFFSTAEQTGNISDRGYFREVMKGRSVLSEPVISKVSGEDIVVAAAPIRHSGEVIGLMGGTIKLKVLSSFINSLKLNYEGAISYIINRNGDFVTYPEEEYIMKENIFDILRSMDIENRLEDGNLGISGDIKYNKEGNNRTLYYQRLEGIQGWYFVAEVSNTYITGYIYEAVEKLYLIGIVGILLALLLSYFTSSSIASPIIKLESVFNKATRGDLKVRANIDREDEIGRAAKAFNKMMNTLNHVRYYDSRTQLPNRRYLDNTLKVLGNHAEQNNERFAVITLNIDQYPRIIDSMGHETGDSLLYEIGQELKSISPKLKVYSWVEAQFVVLLTEIREVSDIYQYIRKISMTINRKWAFNKKEFHVTTSMGIAVYPDNGKNSHTLLKNSSLALHRTLDDSDSSYQFYNPEMNEKLIKDIDLDNAMRIALDEDQFLLYYQPQYDISGEEIIGLEALIRWVHPEQGLISPGAFIPVAEENGLINSIGLWVLEEAARQVVEWSNRGLKEVKVAVNIATSQLMQDDFVNVVSDIINSTGLSADLLELEITERAMVTNVDKTIDQLKRLKELGIKIAIDDFGTGYSSLQYLKDFALTNLKVDKSFIAQLFEKDNTQEIVRAIIAMGHNLNLEVTAEGIEDKEQLEFLKSSGCDFIQGYYFSRPIPVEEIEKLLPIKELV